MKNEGYTHHRGPRGHVPLPTAGQPITPRVPDIECCGLRLRPGAFHVHIEPGAPEPVVEMATPKVIAAERIEKATQMYVGGMSLTEVGRAIGMSYSGVQKMLGKAGVKLRPQGRTRKRAS